MKKDNKFLKEKIFRGLLAAIVIVITGVISFLIVAFDYWAFTLILRNFFSIVVPFTWHYAFGVWLILMLIKAIFSGVKLSLSN